MERNEFLDQIVNRGIEAAKSDYTEENQKHMLEGSIAGFEACRGKSDQELLDLYTNANQESHKYFGTNDEEEMKKYWWHRCYSLEVEWTCNVISAYYASIGAGPLMAHLPTARAVMTMTTILTQ